MASLPVLRFPNPKLRTVAKPIDNVDDEVRTIIDNMFDTMRQKNGIGLAATQVNVHRRIFVADCSSEEEKPNPLVFINPEITWKSEETKIYQEGCLSIPENYADIERADRVTVQAQNRDGEKFIMNCDGLLAVCVQHEIDHLNGKLFTDYLSPAKQLLIRDKMKKMEKRLAKEAKLAKEEAR